MLWYAQFRNWADANFANIGQWLKALESKNDGRYHLFYDALVREYAFGNIRLPILKDVFDAFDNFLSTNKNPDPIGCFTDFICGNQKQPQRFHMLGHLIGTHNGTDDGVRLMRLTTFLIMLRQQIEGDSVSDAASRFRVKELKEHVRQNRHNYAQLARTDQLVRKLITDEVTADEFQGLKIRGPGAGFYWISTCGHIGLRYKERVLSAGKMASVIRKLGLNWCDDDVLAVCVPTHHTESLCPHVPSVFDAQGKHNFFRPAYREDCWGESVNLVRLDEEGAIEGIKPATPWEPHFRDPWNVGALPKKKTGLSRKGWHDLVEVSKGYLDGFTRGVRNC